jgi:hypothetical protein
MKGYETGWGYGWGRITYVSSLLVKYMRDDEPGLKALVVKKSQMLPWQPLLHPRAHLGRVQQNHSRESKHNSVISRVSLLLLLLSLFAERKAHARLNETTRILFLKMPGMAGTIYETIWESVLLTNAGPHSSEVESREFRTWVFASRHHASLQVTRKGQWILWTLICWATLPWRRIRSKVGSHCRMRGVQPLLLWNLLQNRAFTRATIAISQLSPWATGFSSHMEPVTAADNSRISTPLVALLVGASLASACCKAVLVTQPFYSHTFQVFCLSPPSPFHLNICHPPPATGKKLDGSSKPSSKGQPMSLHLESTPCCKWFLLGDVQRAQEI